jgi:addiction module RelE/StbE family toxin
MHILLGRNRHIEIMHIILHKGFVKAFAKLRPGEQAKFRERRDLFLEDAFDPLLNNHALHGKFTGVRSINITGDLRVLYLPLDADVVEFLTVATHAGLYS